jgi:hypothetical protein
MNKWSFNGLVIRFQRWINLLCISSQSLKQLIKCAKKANATIKKLSFPRFNHFIVHLVNDLLVAIVVHDLRICISNNLPVSSILIK